MVPRAVEARGGYGKAEKGEQEIPHDVLRELEALLLCQGSNIIKKMQ